MKTKTSNKPFVLRVVFFLTLAFLSVTVSARTWHVHDNPEMGSDFVSINAAMDVVAEGDTLFLDPGCTLSDDQTIIKRVTIIGTGFLSDLPNTASITGVLNINAAYARFESVNMTGAIYIGADHVTIERCQTGHILWTKQGHYLTLRQSKVGRVLGANPFTNLTPMKAWTYYATIENCIILFNWYYSPIEDLDQATIRHNYVYNEYNSSSACLMYGVSNSKIYDNILLRSVRPNLIFTNCSGNMVYNNVISCTANTYTAYPDNVYLGSADLSTVFSLIGDGDEQYQLCDGSPACGYASDGGDCGPYDGDYPYVPGGLISDEHPKLRVSVSNTDLAEGDMFTLTAKAYPVPETATTLMLTCDNSARFDFPSKLVLPAGETSVTATVTVIDDNDIAETLSAAFTVSAVDYESGQAFVMVSDDDMPHIELVLSPTMVMANAGANAIMGTIRRSDNLNSKVTMVLSDDGDGLLTYSTEKVTLERWATEAHFTIGTKGTLSDDREVNITAAVYVKACDCTAGAQSGGSTTQKVTLLSGHGAPMKIAPLTTGFSTEGGNNGLVITIESAASNAVTVNVTSDSDVNLSYAHAVTIPAGETTVTVPVTMSGSGEIAEGQVITFTATASGYATATCWAVATARSLPDAIVTSFEASAAEAEAESEVELTIMVKNAGNGALSEETPVKVTLSDGSYPVVLRTGKSLASGESMTLTTSYQLPALTGEYFLQAIVNPTGSMEEIVTSNNMSLEVPITIKPSYQVTAVTDKTRYGQGEVITVMGKATGTKSAFADVEVYFVNDGMRQTMKAKTDSEGNYKALFLPLDGTAGHFAIGACFPGEEKTDAMAEVDVFGLKIQSSRTACTIGQGGSYSGCITVTNNGDLPQTGIRVEQQDSPIGCEFSFQTISKIEAGETLEIPFTITSNDDSTEGKERMTLLFRSNEGAMAEHAIDYSIDPAVGCLKTDSTAIVMTITKDKAREFPVTIWNTGLAPTGTVSLTLPSWIQSVTPRQLPSLAPGDTVTVLLRIVPDGKMYENIARTGRVGINCVQGTGLTLQLEVTPVAEENGAITIDVLDEFAWCTEEKPHVTGAKVQLVNKATHTVVSEGLTGADGKFAIAEIPGGWYQLKVSAAYHESYDGMLLVDPGRSRTKEIFISFNGITKEWKVEETEVEDEYSMETVMKFETMVPPPYIEVQWPEEKPVPGKYFPVTFVNKGLLKFYDVKANLHVSSGRYGLEIMGSSDIDTLDAGQAVVLYARLTTASTPAQVKKAVSTVSSDCFGLSSDVEVCYMCVMPIEKSFTSDKNYGKCYVSTNKSSGGNGGGGAGGGAGAGGDDNDNNPPTEDPEEFACDLPRFKIVSVKDGKNMLGVATDGASQVKIVIDGEYDQRLRDLIKEVKWEIAGDDGSTDMGKLENENLLEGAVYTAPSYYSGGDASSYKVKLNVSFVMNDEEENIDSAVEVELIRVPVLMVHGLNSSDECWFTPKKIFDVLLNDSGLYDYLCGSYKPFQLYAIDYSTRHNDSFDKNDHVVGLGFNHLQYHAKKEKYVVSSMDVVAHSMGGLLTKLYIRNHPQEKSKFHKVITINTPHGGSQLGDFFLDPKVQFIREIKDKMEYNWTFRYWKDVTFCPAARKNLQAFFDEFKPTEGDIRNSASAVADLSVMHGYVNNLNNDIDTKEVNCHAIVTKSESFIPALAFWYLGDFDEAFGYTSTNQFLQEIYGGDDNDWIVAAESQKGGLTFPYITERTGGYEKAHIFSCKNDEVQSIVRNLLFSDVDSKFSDGFGKVDNLNYSMPTMTWERLLELYPADKVANAEYLYNKYHEENEDLFSAWKNKSNSNSRARNSIEKDEDEKLSYLSLSCEHAEGDTLMKIKITPFGEFENISFGCYYNQQLFEKVNSAERVIRLPDKIIGEVVIISEGQSLDGSWFARVDTVLVNSIGDTYIRSLSFNKDPLLIINNEYLTPRVFCTWSDGTVTKVVNPRLSVSNGNLAYIEDNKYVYGKNSGRTMLNATYRNLSCSTPLEVYISGREDSTEDKGSGKTSNSVCSSASLGFKQGSVMTRQAFRGTLTINNNHPSLPLQNLKLHIEVRDEEGNLATQREFQINPEALNGDFEGELDFDSGWNLKNGGTGIATILFIPTKNAAPTEPKRWSFGGTLTYTDPFTGLVFTATLKPVTLTVKPTPVLDFTYFMQRDVIGDYPWTPDVTEPSIPAEFALLINNKGNADAKDLKFICKEPQIEDSNGLKISFSIKDTQLNGEQKALAMDDNMPIEVGNLAAQSQAYVQWWLTSSLLGHFTEYDASFNHQTSYGNEDLSLVDQVTILELIHGFTPSQPSAPARAFLVDALEDSKDTPDKIYFTDATQQEVTEASTATITKMSANSYLLTVTPSRGGWTYVNIDSSVGKNMQVASITRQSDGAEIQADNVWLTEVTFVDHDDPTLEDKLHFIGDVPEGGEQYLVTFDYQPTDYLKVERYEGLPEEDVALEEPLTELIVHFNKAVSEETFTMDDLTLYHEGTPVDLSTVGISKTGENAYRLNLGTATNESGYYVLMVNTQTITDSEGFEGTSSPGASWVQNGGHNPNATIVFADAEVKRICVENWDTNEDGELSYGEAAAVTDMGQVFKSNRTITSFNELVYFTNLTEIPQDAFFGCIALQSIVIPEACTTIGNTTFWNCEKLQSINIPAAINSIGNAPFGYCSDLAKITVSAKNETYDSRYDCNAIIHTGTNTLIAGCKNTVIPNDIVSIGEYAFRGVTGLNEITIPHSVESIERYAFIGCNLASLIIPSSVTSITDYTFIGSTMSSIVVEDGNPVYDSREGCNAIIETATNTLVLGCQTTRIPSSIKKIGHYSFTSVKTLTELVIPEGVSSIGSDAFAYTPLTMVSLPKTLEEIGSYAFYGCNDLLTIYSYNSQPPVMQGNKIFINNAGKQDSIFHHATLYVPMGSKSAYQEANEWKRFSNIVEMEPDPNDFINFADAEVKRICVENWDANGDGELSYSEAAAVTDLGIVFKSNRTITSFNELVYFTGLATIGAYAFDGCNNLTSVIIPDGVNEICSAAFQSCYMLSKITIPNTVEEIGSAAFNICRALDNVILPNSLKIIQGSAFSNCTSLTSIYIPKSVISIGTSLGCSSLQSIIVEEGNTVYDSRNNCNAIISTADNKLIAGFSSTVIPNTVTTIGYSAFFENALERTQIEIPHSVTSIEKYAFSFCRGLESLVIPSSVTNIEYKAFSWETNLTSIVVEQGNTVYDSRENCNAIIKTATSELITGCKSTIIPSSVTGIADGAFWGCQELSSIDIPNSVVSIGEGAFYYNSGLTEIVLPSSVRSVGKEAFMNCLALTKVTSLMTDPSAFGINAFSGISSSCVLYIPLGSRNKYVSAGWTEDVFQGGIVEVIPDDYLYANDATIQLGGKKTIALQLDNVSTLIAAEFRLQLPAGLAIEKDENDNLVAAIVGDRRVNHTLTVKDEGNGLYHFLSYSSPIRAYKGNAGDFITLSIVSDGSMEEGTYPATLKNIIFSDENEQKLTFDDSSFNISVIDYTPGDVNSDGSLDVMDVVKMVSYIMGRNPSNFKFVAADIDGNGKVNVMDLVNLINIIMSTPQQSSAITTNAQLGTMELSRSDDASVTMNIPFANHHVAAQFVVSLTDGAVLQEVVTDKAHQSQFIRMPDGRYKVMVFSGNNAVFSSDSPIKLQFSGSGNVMVEEAMFVDTDEEAVAFGSTTLNTIGITTIDTLFACPTDIYTVNGRLVKKEATSMQGLAKGVYIVNNQKLIVK